jgi:alpha-galactosidase
MAYSDKVSGEMYKTHHRVYRKRLYRGEYRDRRRTILINTWKATYFDVNEEKLLNLTKEAKEFGIDLFVLNDGWFGERNNDTSSFGDWYANRRKNPSSLEGLGKKLNKIGLKFGLWFEPEMISPNSELYRKYPNWSIQVKGRSLS